MEIHSPRNTQAVQLYYRGEKMAKVSISLCHVSILSVISRDGSVISSNLTGNGLTGC